MNLSVNTAAIRRYAAAIGLVLVAAGASATSASAIEFESLGASVTDLSGAPSRQAGAHPDVRVKFIVPYRDPSNPVSNPVELPHRLRLDLPPGLVGNPTAISTCPESKLKAGFGGQMAACPVGSQVGIARVIAGGQGTLDAPIYNVDPPVGAPALFAFTAPGGVVVKLTPSVRPDDLGITIDSGAISQGLVINGADVTLWGVPADPIHDVDRFAPIFANYYSTPSASQSPRVPFLTTGTSCPGVPEVTTAFLDGWKTVGNFAVQAFSADFDGLPFVAERCDRLAFDPSINVTAWSRVADAPTGLSVDLKVPQSDAPDGLATAHVKDVSVALPTGMSVSPSSAAGLGACSLSQIGLGSDVDATCPASSKLGTVVVETPLLAEPLTGDVILAQPDTNPFGSLLALYLVAQGSGVTVKLPGRVDANPVSGQLTATFSNNPQLPFSALHVRFDGGPQAALATPTKCDTYTTSADISSWSGKAVKVSSPMTIDQGCEPRGFSPGVSAGSVVPVAGKDSSFVMTIDRQDRQQNLSGVSVTLPPGLLARIRDVNLCPEANAAAGTCPASSQTGTTQVLSGPGSTPLPVRGQVYLTGPYKGAPYGLSIVVPTAGQAGPFDLGNVVVRAQVLVDRTDAHVTVISDPLPTILRGFPLRIRQVVVSNDRPGFHFNPTSCAAKTVDVSLLSTDGARSDTKVPYRLAGCGDLAQDQKVSLAFTNKSQTKPGKHPGVKARMTSKGAGTNLRAVTVKLPLSVSLDPKNAKALCKPDERTARKCPTASIIGNATAVSVLKEPLKGPVYFVEGTRKTKAGKVVPTFPKLWIPLQGGGVTIDVNADSDVRKRQLVTTFANLPDAPISSFDLRIGGGKYGILTVPPNKAGGTCNRDKTVQVELIGQNGKRLERAIKASVAGCKPARKAAKAAKKATVKK